MHTIVKIQKIHKKLFEIENKTILNHPKLEQIHKDIEKKMAQINNLENDIAALKQVSDNLELEKKITKKVMEVQIREDELNWQKARYIAAYECKNTPSGRVAVYVVYDNREYFCSFIKTYYGNGTKDDSYDTFGNYTVCKMEADYCKGGCNEFRYKASGKSTYWYHYINNNKRTGTVEGWEYIKV